MKPEFFYETVGNAVNVFKVEKGIKTVVAIFYDQEDIKDPDMNMPGVAVEWYADTEFHKKMRAEMKAWPAPTELEMAQMQANLYEKRLHQLKVFIDKVPNARELIGSACFTLLKSVYGSRDRAIKEWMHTTTTREEVEGQKQ